MLFSDRFKRKKEPRSVVSIVKSGLDSAVENIMSCKINFTVDMRINAPLIIVIISDKASDMVTLDLGFIEMKSGKTRKICNSNDVKESYHSSKLSQPSLVTGHPKSNDNNNNNNKNNHNLNDNSRNGSYDDDDYSVSGARYTVSVDDKEYGNDILTTEEATYNVTNISLSEIEVSLLSITRSKDCHVKNTINQNSCNNMTNLTNLMRRSRLIEKFDVNIEVQMSDDPWGSPCPPIRLFIDLPKISIRYVLICL